jgi:hypothetical protein
MTQYRILEKDGRYYPQKKYLGLFWYNFHDRVIGDESSYDIEFVKFEDTLEKAQAIINRDYKEGQKTRINPVIKIHHYNPQEQ